MIGDFIFIGIEHRTSGQADVEFGIARRLVHAPADFADDLRFRGDCGEILAFEHFDQQEMLRRIGLIRLVIVAERLRIARAEAAQIGNPAGLCKRFG